MIYNEIENPLDLGGDVEQNDSNKLLDDFKIIKISCLITDNIKPDTI